MIVVLRASGSNLDLDACLTWLPSGRVEAAWRSGEVRRGKAALDSGFNLLLADDDHADQALAAAQRELEGIQEKVKLLARAGVGISVDIGLEVSSTVPRSVSLSQDFIRAVMESGVKLVISAYPCSDDDE
jgi:hypothetical protein